ncbi:restriction endonuclease fold toxin 5 of polymorphic toxin system [Yimella lutea]|uniref:Restriction endonuclease fold toxin 5 of polymorphic toxin system n=1 Tax=Yimella lutea TaxID=587872 RepID=A0A542EJ96_9MICO|nr:MULTISPECIES: Tox-REase-5 domain-containing protein [Yimella]TQJ15405.1 restriction endonuclease fold toxin 5 of polymorphic toxin system [Yimella lutea]
MGYQEQITGAQRTANGHLSEYVRHDPTSGRPVAFDGRTFRGDPPVETFLDAKHGYAQLAHQPRSDWSTGTSDRLVSEAERQVRALPDGARLEWHASDPAGAAAIKDLLDSRGIFEIDVIHTSKV